MAIERSAIERVGGFDERYRLYYEEIDFMRSLARERLEIRYVPEARCRHMYDQSAAGAREHQDKFAESESLYMAKWHPLIAPLIWSIDRPEAPAPPRSAAMSPVAAIPIPNPPEACVVEASPLESFETAAGHFPAGTEVRLPEEIWTGFHGAGLFLRVVEAATGREISRGVIMKSK